MVKVTLLAVLMILTNACYICLDSDKNQTKGWFSGFLNGLQINPDYPSPCLRKASEIDEDFSLMMQNFGDIFRYGDLSLYFDSVSDFTNLIDDIDNSISICQFAMITNQLENLFTPTMGSTIAVRISSRQESLIKYWKGFISEFLTDKYESGFNFGRFFSIIFDYNI